MPLALAWKYPDASIATKEGIIIDWKSNSHPMIPSPAEIAQAESEYITFIAAEKAARRTRKQALLTKLGLNAQQLQGLIELIEDKNGD